MYKKNKQTDSFSDTTLTDALPELSVHGDDMCELSESIDLVMAQIDMSIKDSQLAIDGLIDSMSKTANNTKDIKKQLLNINAKELIDSTVAIEKISTLCDQTDSNIESAIHAFQFYDRFTQRLMRIQENLQDIANVAQSPDQKHSKLWKKMHDNIRAVYSAEQEKQLLKSFHCETLSNNSTKQDNKEKPPSFGETELF